MYLCSQDCEASGSIFNTGMGYFNRAAVVTGPGMQLGDPDAVPTPEMIHENWEKINSIAGAVETEDANAAIFALISPPGEGAAGGDTAAAGDGDVAAVFDNMQAMFNADAAGGVDVVFQFNISGSGGGDWNCVIKDSACTVAAGVHAKPVCTLKMDGSDFTALMNGTLPAMQAYTSGKLKIEGDIMKSQLLEKDFKIGK